MKIEVIPFFTAINKKSVKDKTVVVIDVLRATSVMITALENGVKEIIPCQTIEEAKQIAKKLHPDSFLLCGERNAKKINNFDLGNSPLEYKSELVKDKIIILTTTNGTKALNKCIEAKEVLVGAFLNTITIVEKIKRLNEVVLVCSGTNGKFSLDDGICAAMIMHELSKTKTIIPDDLGYVLMKTYRNSRGDLKPLLKDCYHLNYLLSQGYIEDVEYCLQTNIIENVPVFIQGQGLVN